VLRREKERKKTNKGKGGEIKRKREEMTVQEKRSRGSEAVTSG